MTNILKKSPYPEMIAYDKMPTAAFPPYTMLSNPQNYHSEIINTDRYGYRKTLHQGELKGIDSLRKNDAVSIVVGASTAFGVGASSDSKTIASLLHESTGKAWLNFGIRGAVSIQEYISLILRINEFSRVENILLISGINDLYRNLSDSESSIYDKRFSYQNDYFSYFSARRIAYAYFKSLFTRRTVNQILNPDEVITEIGDFALDKSNETFERQYDRNFSLYAALSKQIGCSITFGFQPFYHVAKKQGTTRETEAIERTELMQADTPWLVVKNRIVENIGFASDVLKKLCKLNNINYIDFNECFDEPVDYFVDTVHLTDAGNKKIVEIYNELVF